MIFTSYFAKLNKLPENVYPIAICAKVPDWYKGAQYSKLAPPYGLLMQWKDNHRNDDYAECFNSVVLENLDIVRVMDELQVMLPDNVKRQMQEPFWRSSKWHVALICYERPDKFCHRHLVADWLCKNGYYCEELR